MRTRPIVFLLLALVQTIPAFSQRGIINKGALIVVNNNAVINLQGGSAASYVSQSNGSLHGRMDLNGKFYLQGSWLNNTTGGNGLINAGTDGEVILAGNTLQTIGGTQTSWFEKLTLNNTAGASLLGSVNLYGNLGLSLGKLSLGSYPLLLSPNSAIAGTPSATAMVVADGTGELRKNFTASGSFLFPVGDNTSTAEYSPASLNFSSGTFGSGAWAGVRVVNAKHSLNSSASAWINRYWVTSLNNISAFSCTPGLVYTDGDINGTEASLFGGMYVNPFWTLLNATNTASNTLTGTVSSLGEFTGGQSAAFSASFTMADDGLINEGAENGESITLTLFNSQFEASLNPANWSLSNAPQGISIGNIVRNSNTQATLTLSGTRTVDYDLNILNMGLTISHLELKNLDAGSVNATTGVKFTASNDAESISMTDDGNITEGAIAGEKIYVTLTGGTFVASLNQSNWLLTNLPSGISIGSITRTGLTTAEITLSGTAADFDTDITNATLSIHEAELDDYTGANLTVNTGVRFIAIDESLIITMANDGNGIAEAAENGEIITVTITNKTFSGTITPANWTLSNLPQGVSKGAVSRTDATHVTIALSGNRTADYDVDISNVTLQIAVGEIVGHSAIASINSGVLLTANNDAESLSISSGLINEGAENNASISVTLLNGTYATPLTRSNWVISNLPAGVSLASVTRNSSTLATLVLSGNRTIDYDTDINLSLSVNEAEVDDYTGVNLTPATGVAKLTANPDNETVSMSDNGITEGAENGRIITVNLLGGTFVNPVNPANWTLTNLPAGVSKGSVSRISSSQVQITLSGNRTTDYDAPITNLTLTVNEAEIDDNTTGVSVATGVVFTAIDEAVSIALSTPLTITEGSENGKTILITLTQDVFAASLSLANWTISNLPAGVTAGSISRTDNTHASVTLSGNRSMDYDNNITNVSVQLAGNQLTQHTASPVSANSGVVLNAVADNELLSMVNDAILTEGAENGQTITVTLTGGTLAASLTPANWSISGQPTGVTLGTVQKLSATQVRLTLSGNRTVDYDVDITTMQLSVNETEIDEYTGANLTVSSGVTFSSTLETLSLSISGSNITEGAENGSSLTVTLSGGTFMSTLDLANWSLNGLPFGVSKGSISRLNSTQAVLTLSGNRTADYDVNITNVTATCKAQEIVAYAGADITSSTGITFLANIEQLSISHAGLSETNLHNAGIGLTLIGDRFEDATLSVGNFSLLNAPSGSTVASVTYTDATHANLKIAYDSANYDFDNNITNFRISINDVELNGVGNLTSNALTITALVEPVSLVISTATGLSETNLGNVTIEVKLVNELFTDNTLSNANFSLLNGPAGLSINSVQWLSNSRANVFLSFNSTDFDSDYTDFRIRIAAAELQGNALLTSNPLLITAIVEIPSMEINAGGAVINEDNLNGSIIGLNLVNTAFIDATLNTANFILSGAPAGSSVASVSWISPTTANLQLAFDGTDFDTDFSAVSIRIKAAEVSAGTDLDAINSFPVQAVVEPPVVTIAASGTLDESTLNGGLISIQLLNINFAIPEPVINSFSLLNAPPGVSIDTIYFQSPTTAMLQFKYDETDFDVDAVISVSASPEAFSSYSGGTVTSNEILLPAVIESNSLQIMSDVDLSEDILNGAHLHLFLVNDSIIAEPEISNFSITGIPFGLEVKEVQLINIHYVLLTLGFKGDIDVDIAGFGVAIQGSILAGDRGLISNELPVTALVEAGYMTISHPGLDEFNLREAQLFLELFETSFADDVIDVANFSLMNAPAGCYIDHVEYMDAAHAVIILGFDGTNFTSSISDFAVSINGIEFNQGISLLSNSLSILASGDPDLTISHPGLSEQNLNGAELSILLNNARFSNETARAINFAALNGPPGLSVDTVIIVSNVEAKLVLAFDGTDFLTNFTGFILAIDPIELLGTSVPLLSNSLTITASTGIFGVDELGLQIYGRNRKIYIATGKADGLEGYAVVYNMTGQAVLTRDLEQKNINVLEMNGPDNSYLVRVFTNRGIFTGKLTLLKE